MYINNKILIGKSNDKELAILLDKANRHGLITGASGSGKTITLKVMAESFSNAGVPVFLADVKGDIAGTCMPGTQSEKVEERLNNLKIKDFKYRGFPIHFWDVYGKKGHPIRTTVKDVGPTILSRMLGLSEAGEGVLAIAFKIAEDKNLPITQTYILLLNNAIQNDKMIKAMPDLLSSLVDLKEINQKLDTISLSQIDAKR